MVKTESNKPRVSQLPTLDQIDRLQVGFLEVEPIGDHELGLMFFGHPDHGAAVFLRHRHGLLAQDVNPAAESPFGILAVEMIGERYIDRVDRTAVQALVEFFVGVPPPDLILACQLLQLLGVAGNEGGQLGVFGVGKSRQHGDLGDVSQTDDGVTDLLGVRRDLAGHRDRYGYWL